MAIENEYGVIIINKKVYLFDLNYDAPKLLKIKSEEYYGITEIDDCIVLPDIIFGILSDKDISNISLKIIYDNNIEKDYLIKLLEKFVNVYSLNLLDLNHIFYMINTNESGARYFSILKNTYKVFSSNAKYTVEDNIKNINNIVNIDVSNLFNIFSSNKKIDIKDNTYISIDTYINKLYSLLNIYDRDEFKLITRIIIAKALIAGMPNSIKGKDIKNYIKYNCSNFYEYKIRTKYYSLIKDIENSMIQIDDSIKSEVKNKMIKLIYINEIRDYKYIVNIINILEENSKIIKTYFDEIDKS